MPRPMKAKTLTHLSAARAGSTYQLHVEDEAGKKALFELTAKQALRLADVLDNLLADEYPMVSGTVVSIERPQAS